MKIYRDVELTEEVEKLDLGILKAGTSKTYEFYVVNDSRALLQNLKFEAESVEVIGPPTLNPNGKDSIIINWHVSLTLKQPLKTSLKITGEEIYR